MSKDLTKEHYEGNKAYRPSMTRARKIKEIIGTNFSELEILDIGCGDGTFGVELKKEGADVYGCDIADSAVVVAKSCLNDVRRVDIETEDLDVFGKKFDVVIVSEVVEHLFKPAQALEKIHTVLKEDGCVVVTTPNFLVWSHRIKMLFGKFRYTKTGFLDEGHIHFYTYTTLVEDLEKSGYEILKENHVIHPKIPEFIGQRFPSLFAFQFVIKARHVS